MSNPKEPLYGRIRFLREMTEYGVISNTPPDVVEDLKELQLLVELHERRPIASTPWIEDFLIRSTENLSRMLGVIGSKEDISWSGLGRLVASLLPVYKLAKEVDHAVKTQIGSEASRKTAKAAGTEDIAKPRKRYRPEKTCEDERASNKKPKLGDINAQGTAPNVTKPGVVQAMTQFLVDNIHQYKDCADELNNRFGVSLEPKDVESKWRAVLAQHNAGIGLSSLQTVLSSYVDLPLRESWETDDILHDTIADAMHPGYPVRTKAHLLKLCNKALNGELFITAAWLSKVFKRRRCFVKAGRGGFIHVPHASEGRTAGKF